MGLERKTITNIDIQEKKGTLNICYMYASNVGKSSMITVPFSYIIECTLERNPTSVSSAGRT